MAPGVLSTPGRVRVPRRRPVARIFGSWRSRPPVRGDHGWMRNSGDVALGRMKVVCAWCVLEGKPGDLGEREPLDDPQPTHSICASHTTQVLEALPSRAFPKASLLIVVRRGDTALYEHLMWSFARVPGVKVIVDRRMRDRRSTQGPIADERRRIATRRIRRGRSSPLGMFTAVRFTPNGIGPVSEPPQTLS